MQDINKFVLKALPDNALWVEARSMLIGKRGMVLDFKIEPEISGATFQQDTGLGVLIGKPASDLIFQLSELSDEIICPMENRTYIAKALPNWSCELASLKQLSISTLKSLSSTTESNPSILKIDRLEAKQLSSVKKISYSLREELELELKAGTDIFSVFVSNEPVSFCFAAAKTKTLWDISIDTLQQYRRLGYAEACVRFAITAMAKQGLNPVWGVVDSNTASQKLAKKLGFEEAYRIAVFSKND